ncbi:CBS and ACT domain-containing protein [Pseudodesulfovibrio senegalensis]|jgi:acetoin utilization protein AcuB|uniref:CBS domain-containing protein n=1 Tax=Pseudodesulfovibrio senegalensis TaxID=1721087 RepID=A0A6N6N2X2_9BACT|nr:CBS and ACT domain-containing protein [Pseudodesulfovibrio senegalensis]KAB1440902.1 CBS domain-containing protein [Pseudodesulfovibrio senegalensis]
MLVREWMTCNVITLGVNSSILDAAEILREKNIRQFPVIDDDNQLVGIVSDRDIRDAMPSKYVPGDGAANGGLTTLTAADIMTPDPISTNSDTCMDIVAEALVKNKVGGLPVVDNGVLKGIITQADVMRFLCSTTGVIRGGIQLAFRLEARPGPLADLLSDLRDKGVVFTSVFTAYDLDNPGYRHAYLRVSDTGDRTVEKLVEHLQAAYELLYYVNEGVTIDLA